MNSPFRLITVIFFLLGIFGACSTQELGHELKVMSFNVRFDNPADEKNAWPNRIQIIEKFILEEMPDIIGIQESLHHQNEDLLQMMPGYAYIGTGRDDGKQGGEFSPVFYRTDIFELLNHSQFWLSATPHVPGSIGWEAVLPRVVVWAHLKHLPSEKEMFVFSTHFSHVSDLARRKSMEFLSLQIMAIANNQPVILLGDFNIAKGSGLYTDMISHLQSQNNLRNAELISEATPENTETTFNGFRSETEPVVIDYIFVNESFGVKQFSVDKVIEDEIFISDHWPVKAILSLP